MINYKRKREREREKEKKKRKEFFFQIVCLFSVKFLLKESKTAKPK